MRTRLIRFVIPVLATILVWAGGNHARGEEGHRYAILIGVQKYSKNSGLSDLSYTEKDIEDLAKVLTDNGYRAADVTVLTQKRALAANDLKLLPTRKNI